MLNTKICIPKVHKEYKYKDLFKILNGYRIGKIREIKRIPYVRNTNFNKIIVIFERWFETEKNKKLNDYLEKGGNIKIFYKEPWFWKCFKLKE